MPQIPEPYKGYQPPQAQGRDFYDNNQYPPVGPLDAYPPAASQYPPVGPSGPASNHVVPPAPPLPELGPYPQYTPYYDTEDVDYYDYGRLPAAASPGDNPGIVTLHDPVLSLNLHAPLNNYFQLYNIFQF